MTGPKRVRRQARENEQSSASLGYIGPPGPWSCRTFVMGHLSFWT